jgi:hypothetical protein
VGITTGSTGEVPGKNYVIEEEEEEEEDDDDKFKIIEVQYNISADMFTFASSE